MWLLINLMNPWWIKNKRKTNFWTVVLFFLWILYSLLHLFCLWWTIMVLKPISDKPRPQMPSKNKVDSGWSLYMSIRWWAWLEQNMWPMLVKRACANFELQTKKWRMSRMWKYIFFTCAHCDSFCKHRSHMLNSSQTLFSFASSQ